MSANTAPRPASKVLTELRSLIPSAPIDYADTLIPAERQAALLLRLQDITTAPVPSEVVTDLPHLRVVHHLSPYAGISHWNGTDWIITLNARDPRTLRRVTLLHEYAHIIWHGHEHQLFAEDTHLRYLQAEQAADYFAWNALIPAHIIADAWTAGIKDIAVLAQLFEVREYTILARLMQLRLWLPAHHRRQPHWSQLIAPAAHPHHRLIDWPNPEVAT